MTPLIYLRFLLKFLALSNDSTVSFVKYQLFCDQPWYQSSPGIEKFASKTGPQASSPISGCKNGKYKIKISNNEKLSSLFLYKAAIRFTNSWRFEGPNLRLSHVQKMSTTYSYDFKKCDPRAVAFACLFHTENQSKIFWFKSKVMKVKFYHSDYFEISR